MLHTDGLEPCPETCAFDIAEFEVDRIPNAKGAQRIATQEALDQVGDEQPPHAEYTILFADGPFAYTVTSFGPRDAEDGIALLRESYDALHAPLTSSERSQA